VGPNVNRINRAFTLEFLARKLLKRKDEKSIFWRVAGKVDVGLKNVSGEGTYCSFLSPCYGHIYFYDLSSSLFFGEKVP
jgi:hypothetical protein